MTNATRPLLVFDGECGFCRAWIERWKRTTGDHVDYAPFQEVAPRFPEIPVERFREAFHLRDSDGRWYRGAEAVFRSLAVAPGGKAALWMYDTLPGFRPASEAVYGIVAVHRPLFDRLTRWIWGAHLVPPGEARTAWIFLRLLGAIALAAFVSLGVQLDGLCGSHGILPARELTHALAERYGAVRYWVLPTLCWLGAGDGMLRALWIGGAAFSALLALGIAPALSLIGIWALYLSLASVCREFLWFQWDGLLLEAVFLSLFLAPWRWQSRPGSDPLPSRLGLWLLRWLLFRLMFSSAAIKLASGDPTWRSLTALEFHYQTQPLPTWTAWFMQQLPASFQKLSALVMFAVEGLAPFLIFAPRRIRFTGAWAMIGLQLLILATGNYGFFNLLALALCVLLFDDAVWPGRARAEVAPPAPRPSRFRAPARLAAAALFAMSLVPLLGALRWPIAWLGPVAAAQSIASPFRTVNSYGLFSVMTTRRDEITIEGSIDGVTWRPYEFRWKPGDVKRRPGFTTPHMPRLDWQMWFAALGDWRSQPWLLWFCQRLLEGSKPVLALLARDPFGGTPPRYVRALVDEYRFTDPATRARTGDWWRREPRGRYCPTLTLVNGRLAAVADDDPAAAP